MKILNKHSVKAYTVPLAKVLFPKLEKTEELTLLILLQSRHSIQVTKIIRKTLASTIPTVSPSHNTCRNMSTREVDT